MTYTLDRAAIRKNWQSANQPKKQQKLRIASTCHPDIQDFNQAAIHRKRELDKIIMP
jgi:hypothetical protein